MNLKDKYLIFSELTETESSTSRSWANSFYLNC